MISNYPGSEEARVALQDLKSVYIDLNDINSYANYVNSLGGNIRLEVGEQDSLTYIAAEKLFNRGHNEEARRSLINYLQTFPEGAFSSNANYYLGSIAFSKKEYDEALQRFKSVIESGDTKFLEESVARTAEMQYLTQDFPAALESFKRLQIIAENPENKQAARLGIMRCALQTGQQEEAQLAANELLKDPKLSPEVEAEARYIRAKAYIDHKAKTPVQYTVPKLNTCWPSTSTIPTTIRMRKRSWKTSPRTARLTSTGWHAVSSFGPIFISARETTFRHVLI